MKTVFKSPFELQPGDIVIASKGPLTVTETSRPPRDLGEALQDRHGERLAPQTGDAFRVMFHTGSGISGTWDGESGFEVQA